MKSIGKVLALLFAAILLCVLLTACGKGKGDYDKSVDKRPDRTSEDILSEKAQLELPVESFNQLTAEEATGLTLAIRGQVTAEALKVSFRLVNGSGVTFVYSYNDILLQKKTDDGWETYRRIDAVQATSFNLQAGGIATELIRPEQYGVTLQSGETYRIAFENAPDVFGEFRVK